MSNVSEAIQPLETEPTKNRQEAKQALAALLQKFLEAEGRKIDWLAKETNIHRQTISRYLHRQTLPDRDTCLKLATAMQLPPEQLLQAAGHLPAHLPAESNHPPELTDPELRLYLSQIGAMPEKTREIIKTILRQEYQTLLDNQNKKSGPV